MSFSIVGIEFNRTLEFAFRDWPIPLVPLAFNGQREVSVRVGRVDGQRLLSGFLRLRTGLSRTHIPAILIDIVVSQTVVSQAIVRIDGDRLVEVINALGEPILGKFVGVVLALEIKLIGFGIAGRFLRSASVRFSRGLPAQPLRDLQGNVTLYRQQIIQFAVVLLSPQFFSVTNVVEFDVNPDGIRPLRNAACQQGWTPSSSPTFCVSTALPL